jgi:flagellar basal body-associated protein FliL
LILAATAKFNPFFEKAGMKKIQYTRTETAIDKKINAYLQAHNFNFKSAKSKTYRQNYFDQLNTEEKQTIIDRLKEFIQQPFTKTSTITQIY